MDERVDHANSSSDHRSSPAHTCSRLLYTDHRKTPGFEASHLASNRRPQPLARRARKRARSMPDASSGLWPARLMPFPCPWWKNT